MINNYLLIILTFLITAGWDVILRFMSLNFNKLPKIIKNIMPFIGDLKPYFKHHTLLSAALIAGNALPVLALTISPAMAFFTNNA